MSDWGWVGPLVNAGLGAWGASQASNAQTAGYQQAAQTANNALQLQGQIYNQNRADLAPWRQYGQAGLAQFANSIGPSFQQSPGYQFAMDQGVRALDRSAAARGSLDSGAQRMALTRFGQGLANQEYGNYQNRLAALAGIGQTAAGQGVQAGMGFGGAAMTGANALGNIQANAGTAQAQGNLAFTNAIRSGVNGLVDYWGGAGGKPGGYGGGY
jgi:hypothetical protein